MAGGFRRYSWILDLVGILFCSFFLARITGVYLAKVLEVKKSIGVMTTAEAPLPERQKKDVAEYKIILERNIFDSTEHKTEEGKEGEMGAETETVPEGEAVRTSLNLNILGVLVVGDGRDKRSSATIATEGGGGGGGGKKGKAEKTTGAKVYAVGGEESFAPNTRLVLVQPDRIEFVNKGRLEFAEIVREFGAGIFGPPTEKVASAEDVKPTKEGETAVKEEGGKFTVDQKEVDNALQNLDRLYTDIRAVPNFSGNKVSGMKILSVKNGSLFAKLGMKRGDILQRINGVELDVRKGFEIFNQLKDQKSITLDLVRQGTPTTLEYEIR